MFLWPEQLCTRNTRIMIHLWWFMYHDMTWWDMTSRCVAILLWLFSLHWTSLCCTESVMLHCVRLHRTYIHRTYQYKRWWTPAEWSANDCLGSSFISFDFNLVISGAAATAIQIQDSTHLCDYVTVARTPSKKNRKTKASNSICGRTLVVVATFGQRRGIVANKSFELNTTSLHLHDCNAAKSASKQKRLPVYCQNIPEKAGPPSNHPSQQILTI